MWEKKILFSEYCQRMKELNRLEFQKTAGLFFHGRVAAAACAA